jgi:septum formation protein
MKIVLASESPFRKRAMDLLGLAYETSPSRIDEKSIRDDDPNELTRKLAEAKARKVASAHPDTLVVSGDAVVLKNGTIYEKPRSKDEAAQFLRELSGGDFQFVTAIAVFHSPKNRMLTAVESSTITFRLLLEREIQDYITRYDVLSCAGAFEGDGVLLFAERISGSYNIGTAVPMSRLVALLREQGLDV